ncbi:sensor domain-containing diguanylate cyclase [Vibrio alfacsensis]|uniref:sensor domain-containing diguanylate cyclase n=1 Tax=Vibrio alfacsensis TaxID=1074311 RepID=UPI002ADD3F23|nr:sensor domain-containing diguanylate cyclase [Vibrio alfacsensis]WQE75092.1 sensor domain-containing diguanylate cyclase [Vibrio alfacsensis]
MKNKWHGFDGNISKTIRMAVLVVLAFSFLNVIHFYMTLKVFQENIANSTLQRTTNYISRTLQEVNNTYTGLSKTLAELYEFKIQEKYERSAMLVDLKKMQETLSVHTVGLVDLKNGLYIDSFGRELTIDTTSERDRWIQEFIELPNDYRYHFYDPQESEYDMLYSFYYDHKLKNDSGQAIGIFGIGINYEAYYSKIQGLDENIDVLFATPSGEIRLPKTMKGQSVFSHYSNVSPEQFQAANMQDQIVYEYGIDKSTLLYLHDFKEINRTLLINMDITDYYVQSMRQHLYSFFLGLGLTIVIVVLNLFNNLYQHRRLSRSAYYDSLTLCRNRQYLESKIERHCYWKHIQKSGYSLIAFDIDHFKHVNDTYGHLEGDRTLTQVASIVRRCLRESDEFIRWGGDEFIVLFDIKAHEAVHIANRMRESVKQETMVSLSIGVTDILIDDSYTSAMGRADCALYEAKQSGRNQVKVC